ncbi:MTOR-associated protein MEAK7 isoform X1 [Choristoneura fumiferana]|uniref:MTOR-associated protein MEAK7 isoform X1 n=1 Tax=Choristoneura fumiferana TaxID=7141 RepID=UPI003D15C580
MGNASKKLAAKCTLLTKEEQKYVAATFRSASKNSDKIREDDLIVSGKLDAVLLEKFWGPQIDPRLAQYLSNFLFGWGPQKRAAVDFNRFAELYVYNVRGTVDEKLMVTYNSLGMDYNAGGELPYQLLKEYCESIVSTYIKIVKASSSPRAKTWIEKGFRGRAAHVQSLAESVASGAGGDAENPPTSCDARQLGQWLVQDTLLAHMTEMVYVTLFGVNKEQQDDSPTRAEAAIVPLLPMVDGLDAMPDYPAFIDLAHIVWLNSHIPQQHQHKWRFLFSSHIHGESFSTMAGRIQDQGPSILIIEDNSGYIFGGYATESWEISSNFSGGEESFLFTLSPRIRCYQTTGYNDHYQYMNHHTKTLPNGLLMGGQFDFGGIWVNADPFGEGSSAESCSTYRGYKRLSKEPKFRIRSLEVWGVGEKPLTVRDSDERDVSVLDVNPEAKAILDMAGRTRHSEGIREPPPL